MKLLPDALGHTAKRPLPQADSRIPSLDGLRGIAVLMVLAVHFTQTAESPDHPLNVFLVQVLRSGWAGVDLFFVLSGFLITGILYDSKQSARYFRNFYMRRVLRIFPLYYASLVVLVLLIPALLPASEPLRHMRLESPWYWTYLANFRIALQGWSEQTYIGHFWSLAIEEQFYMLWPLLVFSMTRRSMLRMCAAFVVAALLVRIGLHMVDRQTAAYVLTPARFDGLAMGGILALLHRGQGGLVRYRRYFQAGVVMSAAGIAGLAMHYGHFQPEVLLIGTIGYTIIGVFFSSVLGLAVCAEAEGRANAALTGRTFSFFGKYSYALYVVHPAIIFFWPAVLSAPAFENRIGLWSVSLALSSVLMLAVCVGVSLLSWHLLEKQFMRFRFHFADGHAQPPRPAPVLAPSASATSTAG